MQAFIAVALATVALFGVFFVVIALSALVTTWAMSYMWEWFITPIFHIAVPPLPYIYGLMVIVGYIVHQQTEVTPKSGSSWWTVITNIFGRPLMLLLIGYIAHLFC